MIRALFGAIALGVLPFSGCGGSSAEDANCSELAHGPACPTGYFYFTDRACQAGGFGCQEHGDLLCHKSCTSDSDCDEGCRSHCRQIGLFSGGDYGCNSTVKICREDDSQDICPT
jgi:hypothetical protein